MKQVSIQDFLTDEQIAEVVALWNGKKSSTDFHRDVLERVIRPNMAVIDRKLGQENDAHYLAYMLEYICSQAETPA